jgi:hypothetical protein
MNAHTQVLPALSIIEARKQLMREIAENELLNDFYTGGQFEHELLIDGMRKFEDSISRFVQTVAETALHAGNANFTNPRGFQELPKDSGQALFSDVVWACQRRIDELRGNA